PRRRRRQDHPFQRCVTRTARPVEVPMSRPFLSRNRSKLTAALVLAAAAAAGVAWTQRSAPASPAPQVVDHALVAPGLVEAKGDRVALAFETSGRITELLVAEGDRVTAGQVVARLDDRIASARAARAAAAVDAARARRDLALRGARPDEIRAA